MLSEAYFENAHQLVQGWFPWFNNVDFNVKDKERPGQPKKFQDEELETLLGLDSSQTQVELAVALDVSRQVISKLLYSLDFVREQGN